MRLLNKIRQNRTFALIGAAASLWLAATTSSQALDKVVYGTASRVGLANAAMFFAEGLGFFKDEGIDISTVQFDGTGVLLPQLATKAVTIGYPIPDFLIISNDTGKDPLPLKFFYNVNWLYNWEIVVPADSPINTLKDLKGKKIGVNSLSTGNVPITRSALKEAGLQVGTDVELITTPQGAAAVEALKSKRVDALNFFDVFHAEIELGGTPLKRIPFPERYRVLFGNSFATHVDTLRDNPDLLERFGRAYSKGLIACYSVSENCVRNMWKMYPTTKPTQGDEAKALAASVKILQVNLGFKMPAGWPEKKEFGYFSKTSWDTLLSIMTENGTIKNPSLDVTKFYTNDLVPGFGKFDAAEVIARAKKAF
jgi:NitT/TauT family transport system substrate-binding protein